MKNKKTFFICIFPLAFIAVLLIIFSVLGSIYRTGYLNEIKLIENNTYRFRISYYDKVFRNSDIYDVYLDTKNTINDNNFIKDIKMNKKGSPFGTLITDKAIDTEKIDNIKYTLKIKEIIYLYALIIYLFSIFLFYYISIVKENKLVLVSASLLIIIQIFIYFSLYNYFRLI
ncbi:hypothetical protein [Brachyspira murdochii]|uniref:hypothetical protein n=1 Tax=Brachyspira murdochii TaxID=84378 RepID=UPI003005F791